MTLKRSSRDPFASMFWDSVEKVLFVPILTLAIFLIHTVISITSLLVEGGVDGHQIYEKVGTVNVGFFWDRIITAPITSILIFLGGVIAAIVLFSFTSSKKKCNVIFSLGLSRKNIFLAKYLGGIAPFAIAIIISALLEIFSNLIKGFTVGLPTIRLALLVVITMIAIYTLAFSTVAVALAFSGNIVEAGVFSVILGVFPNMFGLFFGIMRGIFTYGGVEVYEGKWNFFSPFLSLLFMRYGEGYGTVIGSSNFLYNLYTGAEKITVYDWSGALMALLYSAVILAIALLAFPKRRNEISGYFGRARGLNEICGAMAALYLSLIPLYRLKDSRASGIVIFFIFMITFAFGYIVFRFIFGYKRKKVMVQSAKRIVAYTIAFAVITGIFSTGLFGYSSYVPDAKNVASVSISLELINPYASVELDAVSDGDFGYTPMISRTVSAYDNQTGDTFFLGTGYYSSIYPNFATYDKEEIKKIVEAHKALAKEGKLKPNDDNVCGYGFTIDYTMRDGREVNRSYRTASLESAIKLLGLSDLSEIKRNVETYFYYDPDFMNENGLSDFYNSFCLYSKDFKSRKYFTEFPNGFFTAVHTDLKNLTAQQIFFHKPEDELGVISFASASTENFLEIDEVLDDSGIIYNADTHEVTGNIKDRMKNSAIDADVISTSWGKCVIVTKDMTNTVKFLTDNNLMQYFKSTATADDVKKVKFATRAESVGMKNADMLPIFASGYVTAEYVKEKKDFRETQDHLFAQHGGNSTEDKTTIQTVLDNALLYGYNGNDDRVVEVTYNDGSIATYAIKADVYNKLNIK